MYEKLNWMIPGTARVSHQVLFFVSSVFLLVRVTMVDINKAVGFPEWTAQFSVWKTTGKVGSKVCAIVCQNCAVHSVFSSDMTSHSKIAHFNSECIAPFRHRSELVPQACSLQNIPKSYSEDGGNILLRNVVLPILYTMFVSLEHCRSWNNINEKKFLNSPHRLVWTNILAPSR